LTGSNVLNFKEGRISVEDDHHPGRPSTSKTNEIITLVQNKIKNDGQLTIRKVANEVRISIGTCHSILTNKLGMKRVSAKLVPKLLTEEQMEHRIEVCLELKNLVSNDSSFIKSIITGDETWIRSRNQSSIIAMEDHKFTSSKKMSSDPINDLKRFICH